jgi:hypothetical protein
LDCWLRRWRLSLLVMPQSEQRVIPTLIDLMGCSHNWNCPMTRLP